MHKISRIDILFQTGFICKRTLQPHSVYTSRRKTFHEKSLLNFSHILLLSHWEIPNLLSKAAPHLRTSSELKRKERDWPVQNRKSHVFSYKHFPISLPKKIVTSWKCGLFVKRRWGFPLVWIFSSNSFPLLWLRRHKISLTGHSRLPPVIACPALPDCVSRVFKLSSLFWKNSWLLTVLCYNDRAVWDLLL